MKKRFVIAALLALWVVFPLQAPAVSAGDFKVLDVSERSYDNGPAIAVVLSDPLDPKVRHDRFLRVSDSLELLKSAWVLSDDGRVLYFPHVEPETTYSVVVLAGLESADGRRLEEQVIRNVTTRPITPGVNFASDGLILADQVAKGLPVATINVDRVQIEFFRLKDAGVKDLVRWRNVTARQDYDEISMAKKHGEFVYSGMFDLEAPQNKRRVNHIPVLEIEELRRPGVYFAVMRQLGEYDYAYQATYFIVTDIGLHARIYRDEAFIIASSLKTGRPLDDVELIFYNDKLNPVGFGRTGADGEYRFLENPFKKKVKFIKALRGDHATILPLDIPALDLSEFDLKTRPQREREVFVYSPRDLYRPGETVVLSALLRGHDAGPVPALPIKAELFRPDGRKVRTFTWRPEEVGSSGLNYYQTEIELSGDAQTGTYRLVLHSDPSEKGSGAVFTFKVEDFMPERLKLELDSTAETLGGEGDWKIDVKGAYLYGAPASGLKLTADVRLRSKRDLFESWPGFQFGDADEAGRREAWEWSGDVLDQEGLGLIQVENKWGGLTSPAAVRVMAGLYETGGRPVSRYIERVFWPADSLIGLRPLFDEEQAVSEGSVGFEVIKVGPDGKLRPGQDLLVELTREERDYYWEFSEGSGWRRRYTEKNYKVQSESLDLSGEKPEKYDLQLRAGRYVLAVTDPATGLTSSCRFYVGWFWADDYGRGGARPDKVKMVLDRPGYRPGDTVKLTLTPPHDGDALILVEGRTPLWQKRLPVSAEGVEVEIPVERHWDRHNIFISAVVFRPGDSIEKITPARAVGLIHLPLDRSDRKLDLEIEAPDRVVTRGPTRMPVNISLKGEHEGEVFVTLAMVDVGILNITGFETPDPFAWFFEPRRYEADYYDLYGKVIEIMDGNMARLRVGGDADMAPGGRRPESKIKLLSVFSGPVKFDENGRAGINLDLPQDFNGQVRLMAVAFSRDKFGSAEKETFVAAPVVAQLATPRFMAPGDKTEFTLDLHNLSGQDQELEVDLSAGHPLNLEDGLRKISLADGEKTTLRFPVEAEGGFAASTVKLHLTGEGVDVRGDWQIGVRPAWPGLARKVRRILKAGQTFELDQALLDGLMPSATVADVKISPVLPLNIKEAMRGLLAYPYGCLEQTTSRAYPLLYATSDNVRKFDLTEVEGQDRLAMLDRALERISLMQKPRGGFGLWSPAGPEERWLTAYAAEFLVMARNQGLNVPADVLTKALNRLDYHLQRKWPSWDETSAEADNLDFAVRAYSGYVLARVGRAPLGALRILYDNHRDKAGSGLPLTHLGLALNLMGDETRGRAALKEALKVRYRGHKYWGDYGSRLRDQALMLTLILEHKVEGLDHEKLMLELSDELRYRSYFSTQERFALFRAGLALDRLTNERWQGRLTAEGRETNLEQNGAYVVSMDYNQASRGFVFTSESEGLLYVSAVVGGYTENPPPADDSMIRVDRELYTLKGVRIRDNKFKVGDLVLVHLRVSSIKALPDAILVDLLPAGFEVENPHFENTAKIFDTELEDMVIDGRRIWKHRRAVKMEHEEFRDDRYTAVLDLSRRLMDYHLFYLVRAVSPGTYSMPPLFIESMYQPEIRGIGPTGPPVVIVNEAD